MIDYEQKAIAEAKGWQFKLNKRSSIMQRATKRIQTKIANKIPEKIHEIVTESVKKMVQATLAGSNLTTKAKDTNGLSFEQKETLVMKTIEYYKKAAAIEGAGTGAAGFLLGLADFPLLLSIKIKCLFDIATMYGYDVKKTEERIFILYIFHLAFCSDHLKPILLKEMRSWDQRKNAHTLNWRTFQQEYRDYIDFIKMLQLMPGIGAVVGAYANYHLLDHLGETAINVYRLRVFGML